MKETLNEYAEIKRQIKVLETRADELNPQILDYLKAEEVEEIELEDIGKITLAKRRSWTYTPETLELEKILKSTKKVEEQTGEASYIENAYILFKPLKKDE
jgi:predicted phage-related endonuclease